jgi:hypothetical protein
MMLFLPVLFVALLNPSPEQILERMRIVQAGLETLKARLEQVKSYPQLGIEDPVEKGFLYFQPGKMRLEIQEPGRILLVKDGGTFLSASHPPGHLGKLEGQGTKDFFPVFTGSPELPASREELLGLSARRPTSVESPPHVPREARGPGLLPGDRSVHRHLATPSGAAEVPRSEPERDHPDARGHRAQHAASGKPLRDRDPGRRRENRAGREEREGGRLRERPSQPERAVELTESRILRELSSKAGFLATDFLPRAERESVSRALEAGEVFTTKLPVAVEISGGMVHHWVGAVLVPGVEVEDLVRWLQEYDEHDERFDEVEDSRLLSRERDRFGFPQLRRKKIGTVHYDEHEVLSSHGRTLFDITERWYRGTRTPTCDERRNRREDRGLRRPHPTEVPAGLGGVVVECESLSLSRGVPAAVRWLVGRYLDSVPRESLESTLLPIRERSHRR